MVLTPPVIAVVGHKKSGKTTLIEKIIANLTAQGYRVAAVKYNAPGLQIDIEGKDTYRFSQAGAAAVLIAAAEKTALIQKTTALLPLNELIANYLTDYDLVLIEGGRPPAQYPKIELIHSQRGLLYAAAELQAVVGASDPGLPIPYFNWNDLAGLCEWLRRQFLA